MIGFALAALAALVAFGFASGFWVLAALAAVLGAVHHPVLPLGESVALRRVREEGLDYGRIRLWGSITFIVASLAGGIWIERLSIEHFLWFVVAVQALVVLACASMPASNREPGAVRFAEIARLLAEGRFALFIAVAAAIQVSHVILYGFGALYWQAAGLPESTIGLLWSVGVIAEIALFAWIGRYRHRLSAPLLLGIGAVAGVVRWPLTALTVDPIALIPVQCLHALTFGATHLAAMQFLGENVPERLAATGQAMYATMVGGVAMGLALPVGAWLYATAAGDAFHVMGMLCALATGGALLLARVSKRT